MTPDPLDSAAPVAVERSGRVVATEPGVCVLVCRRTTVRASLGATLLSVIARDSEAAPRPGDRVRALVWADGRWTVERVVARPLADV